MKRDTEPHDPPRRRHSRLRRRSPAFLALCAALAAGGLRGQDREEPGPLAALRGTFFRLPVFRRGDTNVDGQVDISDSIDFLSFLFVGDREPPRCRNAADSNRDGRLDISDASFALGYLFLGSTPPPAPGPDTCGTDRGDAALSCEEYPPCPDDLPLIAHVLGRITFGPTVDLYTTIETRDDLVEYIEEQLAAPDGYDQAVHEARLHRQIEQLELGFRGFPSVAASSQRAKAMLILDAVRSRWQLLHVMALFWNNHFHTQIGSLQQNFFVRAARGGSATEATREAFEAADADDSGTITRSEWNLIRERFPTAIAWEEFRGATADGSLTEQEFLDRRRLSRWKYAGAREQLAISADMERREYNAYRGLAFGRFRDLLEQCAKSAAMLMYLDGVGNTVLAPNENYAREFLELFSLGADRMYVQRDIEDLARVFTGWSVDRVRKAPYDPGDVNFIGHPETRFFPVNLRHPRPLPFPTGEHWDDEVYTWAFVLEGRDARGRVLADFGHDWGRKDLFVRRFGGVDSLGNPVPGSAAVRIALNGINRTVPAALGEFDRVLERVVSFRDCARFISTKLIQLFVTDDLSLLGKKRAMPAWQLEVFESLDIDSNGSLELSEWQEPVPLTLPNGRPVTVFQEIDTDRDGRISRSEYQEPDLLVEAIETWERTEGDIRELLRTILLSDEFLSLEFYRAKVKTPFEAIASAARALDGVFGVSQLIQVADDLSLSGMELFDFADPTGESELGFDWVHTIGLLERLKLISRAVNPETPAQGRMRWNIARFVSRWGLRSAERTANFFSLLVVGGDLLESQRQLAIEVYDAAPRNAVAATAAFVLSLPQFHKQ